MSIKSGIIRDFGQIKALDLYPFFIAVDIPSRFKYPRYGCMMAPEQKPLGINPQGIDVRTALLMTSAGVGCPPPSVV
ncbi:MAG: hypothetical protein V3T17_00065 [Pseudomonadales bacterium]